MQTGLHTIGLGLQRAGIALGILLIGVVFAYVILVIATVASQAVATWG